MKNNRKCIVCGKEYSYCPNCHGDYGKEYWHVNYCDENCKKIYEACAGYSAKQYDKEATAKRLMACDLSGLNHFDEIVKQIINEVMPKNVPANNQNREQNKKYRSQKKIRK